MIPIALATEPPNFSVDVYDRGVAWLAAKGIALNAPPPVKTRFKPFWQACTQQLWEKYSGTCCYLAIFFELATGAASTDHFAAKSAALAEEAYKWDNYRLSALAPNRNKNIYDDVLDPIGLTPNTFSLNLVNGKISPNKNLSAHAKAMARKTIRRLKLDSAIHREMRARHYSDYLGHLHQATLKKYSPFVWYEASRQGLL